MVSTTTLVFRGVRGSFFWMLPVLVAGCIDSPVTPAPDVPPDTVMDAEGDLPAPGPDFGGPDEGPAPDTSGPGEVLPDPDSLPECEPGEGCFLDPCETSGDCLSGWCVGYMGEDVCTVECQTECPAGWTCSQVPGTAPDMVWICVSPHANLCLPCAGPADCKGAGGQDDACLDYDAEGSFCGGACEGDGDCPWGFSCEDAVTVDGVSLHQCVADAGVCPCT
ncbi:MAG: hypothetical protein FJ098_13350, partial [Deltaproteobacteria bacterium]|nr:hypothetical protein [Deltaproteobacteria bacterium]